MEEDRGGGRGDDEDCELTGFPLVVLEVELASDERVVLLEGPEDGSGRSGPGAGLDVPDGTVLDEADVDVADD